MSIDYHQKRLLLLLLLLLLSLLLLFYDEHDGSEDTVLRDPEGNLLVVG